MGDQLAHRPPRRPRNLHGHALVASSSSTLAIPGIQALISYAVGGDDRLARQAIEAFNQSRIPEGITQSRYPSLARTSPIPPFSLLYIGMLHDYWMYRPDPDNLVRSKLDGVRSILDWYAQYREPAGLLHQTPGWSFVDWVNGKEEIPTYDANENSCVTSLFYLGALDQAADLEGTPSATRCLASRDQGNAGPEPPHRNRSPLLVPHAQPPRRQPRPKELLPAGQHPRRPLRRHPTRSPGRRALVATRHRSRHNARRRPLRLLLLPLLPRPRPRPRGSSTGSRKSPQTSAHQPLTAADQYLASISPWRKLLPLHFSTWPETPGETRSDSHAWSAHPIYDLLTLVAGIEPASPGFATVRIAPHLGNLPSLTAQFPHPRGLISVDYHRNGSALDATITLPATLTGTFVFHGSA